ncbi:MAG: response regulator [Thermodesulfobacteriota bacterium]
MSHETLKILLVEDNPDDAEFFRLAIRQDTGRNYELVHAERLSDANGRLDRQEFDLVVTDLELPDSVGLDTFFALKEKTPHIPIIILSGLSDEKAAIRAVREGAQDFLVKDNVQVEGILESIHYAIARRRIGLELQEKALEVMLVEDNPDDAEYLSQVLNEQGIPQFHVVVVDRLSQAIEYLNRHGMDVVLLDLTLPDSCGLETFKRIQKHAVHIPIFIVTMVDDEAVAIEAMRKGAQDYILKGEISSERLVQRIRFAIERKRLEREEVLLMAEKKYKSIIENSFAGIFQTTPEGRYLSANPALARILGYESAEDLMDSVKDIAAQIYVDPQRRLEFARLMETRNGVSGLEAELYRKDGSRIWVMASGRAVRDEHGKTLYYEGVLEDITSMKRAELVLRESEEKYRLLVESIRTEYLIYRHDVHGVFTYLSPSVTDLLGYSVEEFQMHYRTFMTDNPINRDVDRYTELCIQGIPQQPYEVELWHKDGRKRRLEIAETPLLGQDGKVVAVQGIAHDITERKRAEEEKAKLEAQLVQSQKLEAIGRLTGGIAHDFNNLLTPIIGNAEMALSDMSREDPLHEAMEEIRNAGASAASLTRQLLAFSRKQILQPTIMDLNGVVRDMDKMFRRIIGEDVEMQCTLTRDLGRVEADVGQVEQVLMNLVVNARDAMPRGGKLTLETRNVELDESYARDHIAVTPGPYVMLAVSDTGVGMSKEVQARIFEPFFTTKEKGKGTGLGLSTVYGIVKQSKGNIWVYSEQGRGSTFKVYLPRVGALGHARDKVEKGQESLHGSEVILVVEDDEMVRKMTLKILERYGYTVLAAGDAQEALHICRAHKEHVQLILTDVVMPGMSGSDLVEELKETRPGLKILFMSGYTDNAIVHHGILDEGIAFLQKPFTPEGLARKVREVLGTRNAELGTRNE